MDKFKNLTTAGKYRCGLVLVLIVDIASYLWIGKTTSIFFEGKQSLMESFILFPVCWILLGFLGEILDKYY